jgi:hypothetical protein
MPTITIPADMTADLAGALRWAGDTPPGVLFRELIAAGRVWRAAPVRRLLAWAGRRRICVGYESERFLTVGLAGFTGTGWQARMREAKVALRLAAERVTAGIEPAELGGDLWSMGGDEPAINLDALWSWDGRGPHDANPVLPATQADLDRLHARWPASAPSTPSPAPSAPSGRPRGAWVTR